MTRTAGAPMGCQRPSRFWGLGCPKIYHEAEDTLGIQIIRQFTGRACTIEMNNTIGHCHALGSQPFISRQ
ncbi:hypothetical protein [Thiolapillus sp.]|uniref:hypothetical protein n=1 Tax=Thiolapillus sp. TaxID=2017437 RepID=UPI0025DE98CF|nr:hypothetical protein [Thiolapillus sp.]